MCISQRLQLQNFVSVQLCSLENNKLFWKPLFSCKATLLRHPGWQRRKKFIELQTAHETGICNFLFALPYSLTFLLYIYEDVLVLTGSR